jgi:hypothetical protein
MAEMGKGTVSIEEDGKTFIGTYRVEHGVLSLWTMGSDGVSVGSMTIFLRELPLGAPPKCW